MTQTNLDISPAVRRRGFIFLGAAVFCLGFAITLQMALNSNFAGEEMRLTGFQQGLLESIRESCGIIALVIIGLLAALAEPILAALMLALFGIGLGGTAWVQSYTMLIIVNLIWSQGLHVWMPLPSSMAMALAEEGKTGLRLGQIRAVGAAGSGIALIIGLFLSYRGVAIRPMYVVGGVAALIGAAACLGIPMNMRLKRSRFVFRKKYWRYYLLCFLEGWRKQIFVGFAGFLLVKRYGTSLQTMLWLWLGTQALSWILSPLVGWVIDRVGERRVLVVYFAGLIPLFAGYAVIRDPRVLYGIFILDHAFFALAMALTTYVNRIAPKEEHTPTLSMGVAFNHIAACSMPLLGGIIWKTLGPGWVFGLGAAVAAISIGADLTLPKFTPVQQSPST